MIPGPANILSCPFCGSEKEVMSLVSGNTFGGTVWSDTRREYPMLPEVSPIQQCPHCKKYYFIEQAKREYSKDPESEMRSFMKLGNLSFQELKEAINQMESLSLSKMQRWILNHQYFMAYNDAFRRQTETVAFPPSEEDEAFYQQVIEELLDGIDQSSDYELFHAELLRETGRFEEAKEVLSHHKNEEDRWVVDAMLRHINDEDTLPFLLIKEGEVVG
ncbi:hypothetical protein IMSAGC016_00926 [Muribaculaceae bacterium]|nr:hypothetical protein IMSAGC016_00926 [Muribaculaceae bacterium]